MKVALVTSSMPLAPWQNGIARAFVEAGLAAAVVAWEELKQLDDVSRLTSEYPGWMLERQGQHRRKQVIDGQI